MFKKNRNETPIPSPEEASQPTPTRSQAAQAGISQVGLGQPGLKGLGSPLTSPTPVHVSSTATRTLVVGRGITVQGAIEEAEKLIVEGTVETSTIVARELIVAHGGTFRGNAEVETVDLAGTIDGTLHVRGSLVVQTTGRLLGRAECHRLQVEDGGQITGQMEMITAPRPGEIDQYATPNGEHGVIGTIDETAQAEEIEDIIVEES
ncbi:bactofilin family protein [Oecophyllibacter saccharovorans]|uniref:Polymer-forming cytoskeletal protein n=1 Tax=Oecophyllibacter saccharovorans TaxID=2558360 RepID=A0A506ULM4_9PROT|nr:polymer-forming cytoskeletal protein [Oecophyllibacter saccharovorans]TPW34246.1 polymer-forming cytoskeletal protein [Oecophyllibacter saccharovorans]